MMQVGGAPVARVGSERVGSWPAPLETAVLAVLAFITVAAFSILRNFHHEIPQLGPARWPFLSLLGVLFVGLVVTWGISNRTARWTWSPELRAWLGIVIVLSGEKWITAQVAPCVFDLLAIDRGWPRLSDPLFRLWSGLALIAAVVWLGRFVPATARRMKRTLTRARLGQAAAILVVTLGCVVIPLMTLASWLHASGETRTISPTPLLAALSQVVLGSAEELFFRGILQMTLIGWLLSRAHGSNRVPRLLGIAIVSLGFTIEHLDLTLPDRALAQSALFVACLSALLGTLLEVSRNLYLTIAAHVAVNLCVAELIPLPRTPEGIPYLSGATVGLLIVISIFATVTLRHHLDQRRRS